MDKLQEFLGRFVTDQGATFAVGNVATGRWRSSRPILDGRGHEYLPFTGQSAGLIRDIAPARTPA
jgi:hypothetical protein